MHSLLLEFHLHNVSVLDDLLRELNLHEDVDARPKDVQAASDAVVLVALPNAADLLWSVRSTITLFDPRAVELIGRQGR